MAPNIAARVARTRSGHPGRILTGDRAGAIFMDMTQHAYKMRSTPDSPVIYDPARFEDPLPRIRRPESDDTGDDPYRYGWRELRETQDDGSTKLRGAGAWRSGMR